MAKKPEFRITVKGKIPKDLGERISQWQAKAVKAQKGAKP